MVHVDLVSLPQWSGHTCVKGVYPSMTCPDCTFYIRHTTLFLKQLTTNAHHHKTTVSSRVTLISLPQRSEAHFENKGQIWQ